MSQLGSSDEGIAQAVRELQDDAHIALETLVTQTQAPTDQLRGFSPADRHYMGLLPLLENTAGMHTETEVRDIIDTYDRHVETVLRDVKVLISTVDAATKLFANLTLGPAKALRRTRDILLAVLDEGQRCETLPAAAILSNTTTAIAIACEPADRTGQDVRQPQPMVILWPMGQHPQSGSPVGHGRAP